MVYQGSDLIISVDGSVFAASKSCTVDVEADTIKVSSPTDGQWEHSIPGRKSWKVQTSHLVVNNRGQFAKVTMSSPAWGKDGVPTVTFGGATYQSTAARGLHLMRLHKVNGAWRLDTTVYDTYTDDTAINNMVDAITAGDSIWGEDEIICIGSYDSWRLTEAIRAKINQVLQVPLDQIPLATTATNKQVAIIGTRGENSKGIGLTSEAAIAGVHVSAWYGENKVQVPATVVKNMLQRVGQTYTLRMQVDGNGIDTLSGSAICTHAKITATKGNLMQGSFTFEGDGPLQ
ncbi:MAG: hypothetical protein IJ895_06880 [Prevotella sp.]|nr:hypothetical protein [Prevotella sp.]